MSENFLIARRVGETPQDLIEDAPTILQQQLKMHRQMKLLLNRSPKKSDWELLTK